MGHRREDVAVPGEAGRPLQKVILYDRQGMLQRRVHDEEIASIPVEVMKDGDI
jgi:hypothetical protein